MPSLAALRYRNILAPSGGPIASLETGLVSFRGRTLHQANATLSPSLAPQRRSVLFAPVDGSGTHPSPSVARHIAISEALERWALLGTLRSAHRDRYGFGADPTSNGMAAFPGLFARQARRYAWLEAIERHSLFAWWDGLLPGRFRETRHDGVGAVEIPCPFAPATTAVLFAQTPAGRYAYGHAAARTFDAACSRALVELARHEMALEQFTGETQPVTLFERRALFFSTKPGFAEFWERVEGVRGSGFGVRGSGFGVRGSGFGRFLTVRFRGRGPRTRRSGASRSSPLHVNTSKTNTTFSSGDVSPNAAPNFLLIGPTVKTPLLETRPTRG